MSASRTEAVVLASWAAVAGLLVAPVAPSVAAEQEIDGVVGFGGLVGYSAPAGASDARVMFDTRLHADHLGGKPLGVHLDGDLFYDVDDREFRTYRVLDLHLWLAPRDGPVTLTVGRQRVADSTEELADGLGVRVEVGKGFHAGGYGGLIPDPFDTLLSWQSGGAGAVVGYRAARFRAEAVTGFSVRGTGLDRGFIHLSAMGSPARSLTLFGRAKAGSTHASPAIGLEDVFAGASLRPAKVLRLRAAYNAYSSERYVDLVDRDPTLSRFSQRAEALALLDELPNDVLDRTLYHGLAGDADLFDAPHHLALGVRWRHRFAAEPDDRHMLVEGHGGPVALGPGDGLVRAAGRYIRSSGRDVGQAELGAEFPMFKGHLDLGLYVLYSGSPAIDDETRATQGVYGDLFATAWLGKGWSLAAALRLGYEDNPMASAITVDGLLKVSNRFRGGGKRAGPEP